MKPLFVLGAGAAALLMAGCADYGGGFGMGPGPDYYGPGPVAAVTFDGYYDNAYGPFYDGYWGSDGAFYYRSRGERTWRRDDGNHFRREASDGFHPVHGMAARGGHRNRDHADRPG